MLTGKFSNLIDLEGDSDIEVMSFCKTFYELLRFPFQLLSVLNFIDFELDLHSSDSDIFV